MFILPILMRVRDFIRDSRVKNDTNYCIRNKLIGNFGYLIIIATNDNNAKSTPTINVVLNINFR